MRCQFGNLHLYRQLYIAKIGRHEPEVDEENDKSYREDYVWEEVVKRPPKPTRARPLSGADKSHEIVEASSAFKARAGGQKKRKASGQLEEPDTKVPDLVHFDLNVFEM